MCKQAVDVQASSRPTEWRHAGTLLWLALMIKLAIFLPAQVHQDQAPNAAGQPNSTMTYGSGGQCPQQWTKICSVCSLSSMAGHFWPTGRPFDNSQLDAAISERNRQSTPAPFPVCCSYSSQWDESQARATTSSSSEENTPDETTCRCRISLTERIRARRTSRNFPSRVLQKLSQHTKTSVN
uniref:Uncharacterized protein n=1 Tax=Hippocampus comes TaxID=109280 RepID=A0A3Q3D1X5_HIPCM